jgi:hypothetical protein
LRDVVLEMESGQRLQVVPQVATRLVTWSEQQAGTGGQAAGYFGAIHCSYIFRTLFYNALSVTRQYSVDDSVTSEWWWTDVEKDHALGRIRNHGLSVQAMEAYASDRVEMGPAYC